MPEQRMFRAPSMDLSHFGQTLAAWYISQGYEAQSFNTGQGSVVVQMRQPKDWRTYVGAGVGLTITATRLGESVAVEIGAAQWADKVVGGVAALIVFWPLAALPAWGAYRQQELINNTLQYIERYIALGGKVPEAPPSPWAGSAAQPQPARPAALPARPIQPAPPPPPAPAPPTPEELLSPFAPVAGEARCPSCHQPVSAGANFCPHCGARLARTCANCGRSLAPAARFCPHCGTEAPAT